MDKYIGDNVMAMFGAPVAHEDDAERAVRAALGMQDAMTEINEQLGATHGVNLALRVGVNTGEVVAGAVGDGYTVIGDTVNVASRLQSAAQPGSVTVGERTYRATREAIEYRPLEPLTLKGKAEPVPAWEAIGVLAAQPAPAADRDRGAARRPRRQARAARVGLRARGARAPPAPRDRDRPGGRRQVAPAPGAGERGSASASRRRPSARAAACRTARESCTGRWAR